MCFGYDGFQLLHRAGLHQALTVAVMSAAPVDEGGFFPL